MRALEGAELIAPACHDTASAIASIPDSGDDWVYISSGTWSLVGTLLKEPIIGEQSEAFDFNNMGAAGGRICFHKGVNAMWLLRQCITEWAPEIDWTVPSSFKQPNIFRRLPICWMLTTRTCCYREKCLRVSIDNLHSADCKSLKKSASCATDGKSHSPQPGRQVWRSCEHLARITGKKFRRIYIVGGGSRNSLLNRLTANATGLEVRCGAVESSTVGNFAIQLAALEKTGADAAAVAHWAQQLSSAVV